MAPLAPIITQTIAADAACPAGTVVATLAQPPEEVDPGPFTYSTADGAFTVAGTDLQAATELFGANPVNVVATSAGGDSTATAATITVAEYVEPEPPNEWDDVEDQHGDNPMFPPPLAPEAIETSGWQYFLRPAVHAIVPRARDGVDFNVVRKEKDAPLEVVGWDDVVLGAQPTAEIEAEARRLASEWPVNAPLPPG